MTTWKKTMKAVDWKSFRHAYGTAEDLPDLLKKLAKGKKGAFHDIEASAMHQGGLWPAAVPVVEVVTAMIGDGVAPKQPLKLIRTAAEAVGNGLGSADVVEATRVALDKAVPVLIPVLAAGGRDAVKVADLVVHLGTPGPELTAALVDALDSGGKLSWVAARTLGHHDLFPGSDDPRLTVPAALGRFEAGHATGEDVELVAAHADLVTKRENPSWIGSVPRGEEVLLAMEPSSEVAHGLLDAAERSRSITPAVASRVAEFLTSSEEVGEYDFDLLIRLPRTPEVLDAIDQAAPRFDGEILLSQPHASAALILAEAGDPRWERHAETAIRWALEHRDEAESTELYASKDIGVHSPLGIALAEVGVVPGRELATLIGEALEVLDPQGKEFTWWSVARWAATWPAELQEPLRAAAKRLNPLNPHWADSEADLQRIRDEAKDTRDLIPLARHTGLLDDWLAALAATEGTHHEKVDEQFPERDHPQLVAWWQGILADSDHEQEQVAALKGVVEAGAMPVAEGWDRVVALVTPKNYFVGDAARLASEWSDRVDDTARAGLVERLATVVAEAEYDRAECGTVLVRLGGQWPLSPEDTATMVIRDLLTNYKGPDSAVTLCELLRDQEPEATEQFASRMRALLEGDRRLVPSIREDEEKQARLRRCLGLLEQG
ncbi:hypothetical protein [Arachnia propionica]|uniref:Uncharacterized protein n=1 Tax=Arachnia propionica TaxID=1750 RepID=A0A3P1WSV7_9ACTN|nr:hypothetical protein [Arachnia propionica]RRD48867.1 hypothetical protein EII35_10950 [Arachnia propionica]